MTVTVVHSILAFSVIAGVTGFLLLRRARPALRPTLLGFVTCALLYATGDLIWALADNPAVSWLSIVLLLSGSAWIAPIWFLLAVQFAEADGYPLTWGRSAWVRAPLVTALLIWIAVLTNPAHGQYLTPVPGGRSDYHWIWYIHAAQNYLLFLVTAGLYIRLRHVAQLPVVRTNAAIMLAATLAPLVGNSVYVLWPASLPVDTTLTGTALGGLLLIVGIYRTQLFHLLPSALQEIVHHEPDGVLLVSPDGRLRYANAAGRAVLAAGGHSDGSDPFRALAAALRTADDPPAPVTPAALRALCEPPPGGEEQSVFRVGAEGVRWLRITATPILGRHAQATAHCLRLHDVTHLREALAKVKTLSGMLPICASCKKIRDDAGYWQQIDSYIAHHSAAEFSHGICPSCAKDLYPEDYDAMFPDSGEAPRTAPD